MSDAGGYDAFALFHGLKLHFTTNYDYGFERVLIPDFSNLNQSDTDFITKEIKHNLR